MLPESCMRENRTCSLSGGRRLARTCADAPPPTRLKVSGRWCYLYRAIDKQGQLVDSMLSSKRDMAAAQRFFRSAQPVAGRRPEQVTTDGHGSYLLRTENINASGREQGRFPDQI